MNERMKVTNYTNECLYKDTYTIITMMDDDLRSKISNKFISFLQENMDNEFEGTIDNKIPLKRQELRYEVRLMLSLIYINFICDDETQKMYHQFFYSFYPPKCLIIILLTL